MPLEMNLNSTFSLIESALCLRTRFALSCAESILAEDKLLHPLELGVSLAVVEFYCQHLEVLQNCQSRSYCSTTSQVKASMSLALNWLHMALVSAHIDESRSHRYLYNCKSFLRNRLLHLFPNSKEEIFRCFDHIDFIVFDAIESFLVWEKMISGRRLSQPPCIALVLGMHRSGTSCMAGYLHQLGYGHLGEVLQANDGNQRGYHEAAAVYRINNEFMTAAFPGRGYRLLSGDLSRDSSVVGLLSQWRLALADAISDENYLGPVVLKDPRLSVLSRYVMQWYGSSLSFWHVFIMLRNPIASAKSFAKRGKTDFMQAIKMWINYTLQAEYTTRGLPRLILPFPLLVTSKTEWEGRISRFIRSLGLPIKGSIDAVSSDFLDPTLIHESACRSPAHTAIAYSKHEKTVSLALRIYEFLHASSLEECNPCPREMDSFFREYEQTGPHF